MSLPLGAQQRAPQARSCSQQRRGRAPPGRTQVRGRALAGLAWLGAALLCTWTGRGRVGDAWRLFASGSWSRRGELARGRASKPARYASKANEPDLDDIVFLEDSVDASVFAENRLDMPELDVDKQGKKLRSFMDSEVPLTEDPGASTPKSIGPASETLDAAAARMLNKEAGGVKTKRGGKKKRWMMGRGSSKRRKLEENNRLQQWLNENGVWVSEKPDWGVAPSGVSVAVETREQTENEVSGRGIVARRDITHYETLIKVPVKLIMDRDKGLEKWGPKRITKSMSDFTSIALFLINEKFNTEESFWKPYLDVLPTTEEVGCTVFWPQKELDALLEGSPVRNQSMFFRFRVGEEYGILKEKLFDKDPETFPPEAFSLENYEWAYAILFSRAVRLAYRKEGGTAAIREDEEDCVALVPYIDLINHNPQSDTFIQGIEEGIELPFGLQQKERFVSVIADKYYNQYEQIYVSYGQKSNGQLLMLYGFALERNNQDFIEIIVKHLVESSPMAEAKKIFLEKSGFDREAFPLYRDRWTNEMMQFMRLMVLEPADMKMGNETDDEMLAKRMEELALGRAFGEVSERRAMLCLRGLCEELFTGYPTTLEQDEEVLNDRSMFELLPKNQRMALRVRFGEKMILRNTINTIDKILNNLGKLTEMEEEDAKYWEENKDSVWGRIRLKESPAIQASNLEELMNELDI